MHPFVKIESIFCKMNPLEFCILFVALSQKEQVGNRLPALFSRETGATRTSVFAFACEMRSKAKGVSARKQNSGGNDYAPPPKQQTPLVRSSSPVFRTIKKP